MALHLKDLPDPKGKPIIGNLFTLDLHQLHNSIEEWADVYGDIFRLDLGIFQQLVVTRPSMIQTIMKERPHSFKRSEKLNKVIQEGGVHGVFNAEGNEWRKHRTIVAKGLDVKHQKDFHPVIEPILGRLYAKWCDRAASGEAFNIQKDLLHFTVHVTASLAFSL